MIRTTAAGLAALMLAVSAGAAFAEAPFKTAATTAGDVFVDANGMTLYTYDKDTTPNETTCYDQCATNWPPAIAAADATPEGDWTLVDRTDGSKMWAYKGKPLYLWVKDAKPGDITGDGVGGVWHLAKP